MLRVLMVTRNYPLQTQQREARLLEENAEYERAISSCEIKIQEKLQEAELLLSKLKVRNLVS